MLHDLARGWTPQEMIAYARRRSMRISAVEHISPVLLHARIGADLARREFGVDDPEVLGAIERHTVAVPNMSVLEKCLYLADSIEPARRFPDRDKLAALAQASLDEALLGSVRSSLRYLLERGVTIAAQTIDLYNQLVERYGAK